MFIALCAIDYYNNMHAGSLTGVQGVQRLPGVHDILVSRFLGVQGVQVFPGVHNVPAVSRFLGVQGVCGSWSVNDVLVFLVCQGFLVSKVSGGSWSVYDAFVFPVHWGLLVAKVSGGFWSVHDVLVPGVLTFLGVWRFTASHIKGVHKNLADALSFLCNYPQASLQSLGIIPQPLIELLSIITSKPDWTSQNWSRLWSSTFRKA